MKDFTVNKDEMMTTLFFAVAFVGGMFIGGYVGLVVFG